MDIVLEQSNFGVYTMKRANHHMVKIELESSLRDGLLYPFAVGCIPGESCAPISLIYEAANLIGRSPRVLLAGAESVHPHLHLEIHFDGFI